MKQRLNLIEFENYEIESDMIPKIYLGILSTRQQMPEMQLLWFEMQPQNFNFKSIWIQYLNFLLSASKMRVLIQKALWWCSITNMARKRMAKYLLNALGRDRYIIDHPDHEVVQELSRGDEVPR